MKKRRPQVKVLPSVRWSASLARDAGPTARLEAKAARRHPASRTAWAAAAKEPQRRAEELRAVRRYTVDAVDRLRCGPVERWPTDLRSQNCLLTEICSEAHHGIRHAASLKAVLGDLPPHAAALRSAGQREARAASPDSVPHTVGRMNGIPVPSAP